MNMQTTICKHQQIGHEEKIEKKGSFGKENRRKRGIQFEVTLRTAKE